LDALRVEIDAAGAMLRRAGRRVGSLYLGGGTPTVLTAAQLDALLTQLRGAFDLSRCREICVEAGRPETITRDRLAVLAAHGVTRVSVNPQTLSDAVLRGVGRLHTARDIADACALTRSVSADFIINMDLIAGLPGDCDAGLIASVEGVIALGPENITLHALARKRGAPLQYGPRGQLAAEVIDACGARLRAAGYRPYYLYRQKYSAGGLENVGWALPKTESFYNICMMEELGDTVALGAGGVTKLCDPWGGAIRRVSNPKYPREYIREAPRVARTKATLLDGEK
jgi:oxygen-independent coproporphyrinogen-3 oxidase